MIKILANDGIDPAGKQLLEAAGFIIDTNNIPQEELATRLQNYDGITVRSATKVRKVLIDVCPNLKLIGRGGVGMDNIDVEYAREKGVVVIISCRTGIWSLVYRCQVFAGQQSENAC